MPPANFRQAFSLLKFVCGEKREVILGSIEFQPPARATEREPDRDFDGGVLEIDQPLKDSVQRHFAKTLARRSDKHS